MSLRGAAIHQKREMISFESAQEIMLKKLPQLQEETVPLASAKDRVLARDIKAREDQPAKPLSSRDGYTFKASPDGQQLLLTIAGESRAGGSPQEELAEGTATRIFTGAPLPLGADTVLMQEDTVTEDGKLVIEAGYPSGKYVRTVGSDCKCGDLMLKAGTTIQPAHLALLASLGVIHIPVTRKPTVGFLVNGDEIVSPGTFPCPAGSIRNSNKIAVENLIIEAGASPIYLGSIGDSQEALRKVFAQAPPVDILLTIGGASVGDYDYVLQTAIDEGYEIAFSRIALKPGKPTIFGIKGNKRLIGLPGNPVSCIVVFQLLVRPLLRALAGANEFHLASSKAVLLADEKKEPLRRYFLPGQLKVTEEGKMAAIPSRFRESSALGSLAEATVLIVLPEGVDFIKAGKEVIVLHLDRKEVPL